MRVLLLGGTEVGLRLAPLLAREGHQVAVIDGDLERVEAMARHDHVEGFLATQPLMDSLRQAGMSNADVFLALTDSDNLNAMAAQVAQHVFHVAKVICRIDDPDRQQVYADLGMNVVSPTMVLVEAIHSAIRA